MLAGRVMELMSVGMHIAIDHLEVRSFRGVREGRLSGFANVNVFVGRNGCGKSSILEALYIALALDHGLSYVVRRRGWFGLASVDSLFFNKGRKAVVEAFLRDGSRESVVIEPSVPRASDISVLRERGLDVARLAVLRLIAEGRVTRIARLYIDAGSRYNSIVEVGAEAKEVCRAIFLDWNSVYVYGTPEEIFSRMMMEGGEEAKESVIEVLRSEYSELRDLVTLRVHDEWVLHVVFRDRAVPYYVIGDGVRYALAYLMTVLTPKSTVLLMEEPELHMHPSLMRLVARSILRSFTERKNQVFISTHSLELIEALVEEATSLGLGDSDLKIFRLRLVDGVLGSEVYTLSEAREALEKLGWDLRR